MHALVFGWARRRRIRTFEAARKKPEFKIDVELRLRIAPHPRYFRAFDHNILGRDVGMARFVSGADFFNFIHDILAFGDFAEHAITPTLR